MTKRDKDTRDEFSPNVKTVTAQRAAYRCSNPSCRVLTVGPHSDESKALNRGICGHIHAAAPKGPRYEANQTEEERKSPRNAIWVCGSCSPLIDKDDERFPASLLQKWKIEHEEWVNGDNLIPTFPSLTIQTMGILTPQYGSFNVDAQFMVRDHSLKIQATSRHEIHELKIRIQFPESIVNDEVHDNVGLQFMPERPQMSIKVRGGAKVSGVAGRHPTNVWTLTVKRLLSDRPIILSLKTIPSVADHPLISASEKLFTWAEGSFLYKEQKQFFERSFIVPIYPEGERSYVAGPAEDDDGHRTLVKQFFFS